MELIQKRYINGESFTLSRLFVDGNVLSECFVLEDKVREISGIPVDQWKVPGETAIPVGRYKVIIDMSQRFGKLMLHVLDVPGFNGIRVHAGNSAKDTEGCLLVGLACDEKKGEIFESKAALDPLFEKINETLSKGAEVFWRIDAPLTDAHPISTDYKNF